MGDAPAEDPPPSGLRQHWPVLVPFAALTVAAAVVAGWILCVLIGSPTTAPQQANPTLWVIAIAGLWLLVTAAAWGFASLGSTLAGLQGAARRRWRLIALGSILITWTIVVLTYVTNR